MNPGLASAIWWTQSPLPHFLGLPSERCATCFCGLSLNLRRMIQNVSCYPHSTDEKTEVQAHSNQREPEGQRHRWCPCLTPW